jgi:hypothetical protein
LLIESDDDLGERTVNEPLPRAPRNGLDRGPVLLQLMNGVTPSPVPDVHQIVVASGSCSFLGVGLKSENNKLRLVYRDKFRRGSSRGRRCRESGCDRPKRAGVAVEHRSLGPRNPWSQWSKASGVDSRRGRKRDGCAVRRSSARAFPRQDPRVGFRQGWSRRPASIRRRRISGRSDSLPIGRVDTASWPTPAAGSETQTGTEIPRTYG